MGSHSKLSHEGVLQHAFMAAIQNLIDTNFSAEKLHQFLVEFQILPKGNDLFTDAVIETILINHSILSDNDVNPDRLLGVVESDEGQRIEFFFLNLEPENDLNRENYLASTKVSNEC